jgi:hypothetical protein
MLRGPQTRELDQLLKEVLVPLLSLNSRVKPPASRRLDLGVSRHLTARNTTNVSTGLLEFALHTVESASHQLTALLFASWQFDCLDHRFSGLGA